MNTYSTFIGRNLARLAMPLLVVGLLSAITLHAGVNEFVHMVADINQSPTSSNPSGFNVFNNELYFTATDASHGIEMWQYDGSNLTRITDLSPGTANSFPSGYTIYNGELYFRASATTDGTIDIQLWKYDGVNLTQVTSINHGGFNPAGMTVYNNNLYFSANDGTHGTELWQYDGTTASMVADIYTGSASSVPTGFTVYNGVMYFAASNNIYGSELYTYDGTTVSRLDINPGIPSSNPSGLTVFNNVLYFSATGSSTYGAELWELDSFNQVYGQIADINPGPSSSNPANFKVFNNTLYFSANDGSNGTELWKYDGVNAPSRVSQIAAGSSSANPANLCLYNSALYFSATDNTSGTEVWKYDGTTFTRITDINPGSGNSAPTGLTVYNGTLYFAATDANSQKEVWKYDGTAVTQLPKINLATGSSNPSGGIEFNGSYYFNAQASNSALGNYFYKYDGTNVALVSTTQVPSGGRAVFNGYLYFDTKKFDGTNFTSLSGTLPSSVSEMFVWNNTIYCAAVDSLYGRELWKCDGTNFTRIADIYPGNSSSNPSLFTVFSNALYFVANSNNTYALWKYDGTNVSRAATNTIGSLNSIQQYNGALYMGAAVNGTDIEPCKFDGSNFTQIAEISLIASNASPVFWTNYHGSAYFSADDGVHGQQLYSYNGTNVTLITPNGFVGGFYLFSYNDTIYFMGKLTALDYELWKYDGTTVSQVADINPGPTGSLPTPMSPFRNSYMFYANDGAHGVELWQLDALSNVFRLTGATRQGNDVSLNWLSPAGWTNVLQSSDTLDGGGNFTDLSGPVVSTNFTDVGGALHPSRYYRLRVGP